jgi:hypothetical protein
MSFTNDLESFFERARKTSEETLDLIFESRINRRLVRAMREESERYRETEQFVKRNQRQRVKSQSRGGGELDAFPYRV